MRKKDHGFRRVAPGVMVNVGSGIKVSIPHPEFVWIALNADETAMLGSHENIYGFSSEEKVKEILHDIDPSQYVLRMYSWDELVDELGEQYSSIMIDPKRGPGFYQTVPLRKGI